MKSKSMRKDILSNVGRRRATQRAVQEAIKTQQRMQEEYVERRKIREEIWDGEHEETVIYRAYPMMSDYYGSVGPFFTTMVCFLVIFLCGIILYYFGLSVYEKGWEGTMLDYQALLEECKWNDAVGLVLYVVFMGSLLFVSPILTGYIEATKTIFTDKCVYVYRFLRRDRVVSYEELTEMIKRRKICIKNGRYLLPCKGPDIAISMVEGRFPHELFEFLERKCDIELPDEDLEAQARRSGVGWALGRLGAGILLGFNLFITIFIYVIEGEFAWTYLFFDFYKNPLTWLLIALVGAGLVANFMILPSVAFAYSEWDEVIRVSEIPLLVDVLMIGLLLGSYFIVGDMAESYQENERIRAEAVVKQEMQQSFIRSFSQEIWGKDFETITAEEFAQIKYISIDYGGSGNTIVRYSMRDYKDCADEQEFQKSIRTWQCGEEEYLHTPADISMLTGLTYVKVPKYSHLMESMLPTDNRITRIEMQDSPAVLDGVINPEVLEVLWIDCCEEEDCLEYLKKYPNLRELVFTNTAYYGEINLNQLTCINSLERLQLACGENYVNLDVLKEADNLRALSIDKATLGQCSFLGEMKELEELEICYGEDGDLTILSDLPKLRRLWFWDYEAVESSQLAAVSGIEELKVTVKADDSLSAIEQLKEKEQLRVLDITFKVNGIRFYLEDEEDGFDLSEFTKITGLRELEVEFGGFASAYGIEAIARMNRLESFVFKGRVTTDVLLDRANLPVNRTLKTLCLSRCKVKDCETKEPVVADFLTAFKGMSNLSLLRFAAEEIQSFDFLNSLENLETLTVDDFDLTDSQKQEIMKWEEKIEVHYY